MLNSSQRNTYYHSRLLHDITPTVRASVYGTDGNSDTYITNKVASKTVPAFERIGSKFIELNDVAESSALENGSPVYTGGDKGNLLYRSRNYLKVGGSDLERYRSIILLNPRSYLNGAVSTITGYTAGSPYTVVNGTLTLTLISGTPGTPLEAVLLPLNSSVDYSVSWNKPSEATETQWTLAGGDVEPSTSEIICSGVWNGAKVSFDVTPFLNIWDSSGSSLFAVMIKSTETSSEVLQFHSWENESAPIGGGSLLNCKFLAGGDANSVSTEGIRVLITVGDTTTVSLADENPSAVQQWNSFGAATSTGATFSLFSPDTEQGVVLGTVVCTLNDRTSSAVGSPLVVSGISLPSNITEYYTTAEFSSASTIPTGTSIIEIASPSDQTAIDVGGLVESQTILVNYVAGTATNNAHSFTVKFTADERRKHDRVRIYTNENTVSENRIGLNTELQRVANRPILNTDILLS